MPHLILKLGAGRSESQKRALADALTNALTSTMGCDESNVSVAIEDVALSDWTEKVYVPEIQGKADLIYKNPGYDPFK